VVSLLRRLNPNVRISVQVADAANREVLEDAGCDAIVSSSAVLSAMLVRGVQDLGALDVVHDLISSQGGSQIYRVGVPARLIGQSFRAYALALIDHRATPVALVRGRDILTNPDPQLRLEADDDAFVICRAPPAIE
jgi:Trk K+ transport system NAD-binding subunit